MEEIARFVMLARSDRFTVTELCEQFGIRGKTAFKHLGRFAAEGMKGLGPRSHRPHSFLQRTDESVERLVLSERRLHHTWGPKKLRKVLEVRHGIEAPPACSTIGEILRPHGLRGSEKGAMPYSLLEATPGAADAQPAPANIGCALQFALVPGSADAAFVVTLSPGVYTVNASGVGGTTGTTLVEVYLVP